MSDVSDMMPTDGNDETLALDFALGALDGQSMRAAELRLRRDPEFARDVEAWQSQLSPLADEVAPVPAPPAVWQQIESELFRVSTTRTVGEPASRGLWANLALWRGLAFGTSAVAAAALGLVFTRPPAIAPVIVAAPVTPAGLLAASMASTDKTKAVLITATYDPDRGAVILTPAAADSSRGLTPELWVIAGKEAPRSLGVIDFHGAQAHPIPVALRGRLASGVTLAISLEPAGGSPTGAPTGPVVASGMLAAI